MWRGVGLLLWISVIVPAQAQSPARHLAVQTQAYGADPQQQIDVYAPNHQRVGVPILVMVHGGGWRVGDKAHRAVIDQKLAYWRDQRGFVVVSVNYRLLPTPVQAQLGDVAQALRYIQQHATTWGADPQQLILMGHSAGAHLVSLLSTMPTWLPADQQPAPWRMTIALDSAAYDMVALMQRPHLRLYDQAFGQHRTDWQQLSPIHQVHQAVMPMLLVCSSRRADQACQQATEFAHHAQTWGSVVRVLPVDLSHRQINQQLGRNVTYSQAVDQWIEQQLTRTSLQAR